jgi:two-component system response regulator YesN
MRILIVDDEPIQRKALQMELSRLPLSREVTAFAEAANGQACLDLVDSFDPHVIFMDLRMPVMGGLEAATILLNRRSVKIVFLTAFDDFQYAREAVKLGAVDYLLKPAGREELDRVVQKVCALVESEESERREKARLLEQIEKIKPFIELEYVNEIAEGLPLTRQAHLDKAELLGLTEPLSWVLLLDIEYSAVSSSSETDRQTLKQNIYEILRAEVSEERGLIGRLGSGRLACLVGLPEKEGKDWCMSLAQRIRQRIRDEVSCPVSLGVSRCYDSPLELHRALAESRQVLDYKYVFGTGNILHIDDIKPDEGVLVRDLPREADRAMGEAMRLGDGERLASLLVDAGRDLYLLGQSDPAQARFRGIEVVVLLLRAALEGGAPDSAVALAQRQLERLLNCQSLGEMGLLLESLAQELAGLVNSVRNVRNQRMVKKAVDYIKSHYKEQLTLDELARQVYLSPFYFSHIFKAEMSATFVEYLTSVRIDAAKAKLQNTVVSIGTIAEEVGYNDVNYFSRVFRKVSGLTPTQYRERMYSGT